MPRSARRKAQASEDDVAEDDDFAWQSPKKKSKSKGKKSTGRTSRSSSARSSSTRSSSTKAAGKSSTKKKSKSSKSSSAEGSTRSSKSKGSSKKRSSSGSGGASSSARKSGSARRKRSSSGEEDLGGSGRRRRMPAKKKGADPIVPISIVTATLLICAGVFLFFRQPEKIVVNEQNDWDDAKKIEEEGMAAYRSFVQARNSDQPDLIKQRREEAILKLRAAVEAMNKVLDPKRDAEGMLPPDFEGYERDLSQITKYLIDLEKM